MSPIEVVTHPVEAAPNAIWVDDSKAAPHGCAIARTYDDAVRMLRRFRYDVLYLDHDLGDGPTGLDLLRQLKREGICPARVECISWNPVGRKNILDELARVSAPSKEEPTNE